MRPPEMSWLRASSSLVHQSNPTHGLQAIKIDIDPYLFQHTARYVHCRYPWHHTLFVRVLHRQIRANLQPLKNVRLTQIHIQATVRVNFERLFNRQIVRYCPRPRLKAAVASFNAWSISPPVERIGLHLPAPHGSGNKLELRPRLQLRLSRAW